MVALDRHIKSRSATRGKMKHFPLDDSVDERVNIWIFGGLARKRLSTAPRMVGPAFREQAGREKGFVVRFSRLPANVGPPDKDRHCQVP